MFLVSRAPAPRPPVGSPHPLAPAPGTPAPGRRGSEPTASHRAAAFSSFLLGGWVGGGGEDLGGRGPAGDRGRLEGRGREEAFAAALAGDRIQSPRRLPRPPGGGGRARGRPAGWASGRALVGGARRGAGTRAPGAAWVAGGREGSLRGVGRSAVPRPVWLSFVSLCLHSRNLFVSEMEHVFAAWPAPAKRRPGGRGRRRAGAQRSCRASCPPGYFSLSACLCCSALEFSEVTDVSPDLQKGWCSQHEEVAILGHF